MALWSQRTPTVTSGFPLKDVVLEYHEIPYVEDTTRNWNDYRALALYELSGVFPNTQAGQEQAHRTYELLKRAGCKVDYIASADRTFSNVSFPVDHKDVKGKTIAEILLTPDCVAPFYAMGGKTFDLGFFQGTINLKPAPGKPAGTLMWDEKDNDGTNAFENVLCFHNANYKREGTALYFDDPHTIRALIMMAARVPDINQYRQPFDLHPTNRPNYLYAHQQSEMRSKHERAAKPMPHGFPEAWKEQGGARGR